MHQNTHPHHGRLHLYIVTLSNRSWAPPPAIRTPQPHGVAPMRAIAAGTGGHTGEKARHQAASGGIKRRRRITHTHILFFLHRYIDNICTYIAYIHRYTRIALDTCTLKGAEETSCYGCLFAPLKHTTGERMKYTRRAQRGRVRAGTHGYWVHTT